MLFVVLNFIKLCKYCNFHSEVYFDNKFKTILVDLLLFVQELYSKEPGGVWYTPVTLTLKHIFTDLWFP